MHERNQQWLWSVPSVSHGTHACTSSASLASFQEGGRAAPKVAALQQRTTSATSSLHHALMSADQSHESHTLSTASEIEATTHVAAYAG
jgi:hypothetical protein